jgi:hypothetical protein
VGICRGICKATPRSDLNEGLAVLHHAASKHSFSESDNVHVCHTIRQSEKTYSRRRLGLQFFNLYAVKLPVNCSSIRIGPCFAVRPSTPPSSSIGRCLLPPYPHSLRTRCASPLLLRSPCWLVRFQTRCQPRRRQPLRQYQHRHCPLLPRRILLRLLSRLTSSRCSLRSKPTPLWRTMAQSEAAATSTPLQSAENGARFQTPSARLTPMPCFAFRRRPQRRQLRYSRELDHASTIG